MSSRTAEAVAAAVAGLRAEGREASGVTCDVSDLAQVEALAEHAVRTFGRFDVWINNAGYAPPFGPTMHIAPSAFMAAVQTNIIGTYNGSLVALRTFLPEGRGKLINILGRGSDGKPVDMQNGYAASKAWERSFTLGLAKEYKDTGRRHLRDQSGHDEHRLPDRPAGRLGLREAAERHADHHPHVGDAARSARAEGRLAGVERDGRQDRAGAHRNGAGQDARRRAARRLAPLLRRPAPPLDMKVTVIPAALPLMRRR